MYYFQVKLGWVDYWIDYTSITWVHSWTPCFCSLLIPTWSGWRYLKALQLHQLPLLSCKGSTFARFSIPQTVSDNSSCFTSGEFEEILKLNGIVRLSTAPYHPQSNGLTERMVKAFKSGMKKLSKSTVDLKIARFLFHYWVMPHSTTGMSQPCLQVNVVLSNGSALWNHKSWTINFNVYWDIIFRGLFSITFWSSLF